MFPEHFYYNNIPQQSVSQSGSLFQQHTISNKQTTSNQHTMSSNNKRTCDTIAIYNNKRQKTDTVYQRCVVRMNAKPKIHCIPYLPDEVFRNIMSYIVVPDKTEHREKMQAVFTDITTMHLYNPVKDFVYYDPQMKCSMYDSDEYARNDTPAVLQRAQGGENDGSWDMYQFDVRFQSTWETRKTIEWFRDGEQYYGIWGFYQRAKNMKLYYEPTSPRYEG